MSRLKFWSNGLIYSGSLFSSLFFSLSSNFPLRCNTPYKVWYQLAGLCALAACNEVGPSLAPLQLGVGIPGGAEAISHAVQAALATDPEAAFLTVDQANAFNSVTRSAVFEAVKEHVPKLLPFVQWAYGAPTSLHLVGAHPNTPPIQSQTGVRQGDPLGPLLFALALQRSLQRSQQAGLLVSQ